MGLFAFVWFIRVHSGAPCGPFLFIRALLGVDAFIFVRLLHSGSFGSFGCDLGVDGFICVCLAHSGSFGSFGRILGVRLVLSGESFGWFRVALGVIGYFRVG